MLATPLASAVAPGVAYTSSPKGSTSGTTIVVWPTGTNDTANLQAAFNHCSAMMSRCTIQLEAGTYYTDQIAAYGFRGSFLGMGEGKTIIQALPDLPSPAAAFNTATSPFYLGFPGVANPWPVLFTFVNGSFTVAGMTLTEPYAQPVVGWTSGSVQYTALYAMLLVDGWHARAAIDRVTFLGSRGDYDGYNVQQAALGFYGTFENPAATTSPYQYPLYGTFTVSNCYFHTVSTGVWLYNVQAMVTVTGSQVAGAIIGYGYNDVSNTTVTVRDSMATQIVYVAGFLAYQSYSWQATGPTRVLLVGDTFSVGKGANSIVLADFGSPSTLAASVMDTTVWTNTRCGCYNASLPLYYSEVISFGLKSAEFLGNRLYQAGSAGIYVTNGPASILDNRVNGAYAGIWLDDASSSHVRNNVIQNSAAFGIALTDYTSATMVVHNFVQSSGLYDLYWDQTGTGNVWLRNFYSTSSPGGLSSGHY